MYVHASMTALKWKTGNGTSLSMFVDNKVLNPQRALYMRVCPCVGPVNYQSRMALK